MTCPEGVEDMLTAKPGGIPQIIDRMKRPTLHGGANVKKHWLLPHGECGSPEGKALWDIYVCGFTTLWIIHLDFWHNMYYRGGVFFMTISLRLNDTDSKMIKAYADIHGMSVSSLIRESVLEKIENEYDLKDYEEAMAEYRANPITYDFVDVCKELDLLGNIL